jgi:hypothetical protein
VIFNANPNYFEECSFDGHESKVGAMGWGEELACQAGAQMAEIVG